MDRVVVKRSAFKELGNISPPYNKKIVEPIDKLSQDPMPKGVKKLKGEEAYKIRVAENCLQY